MKRKKPTAAKVFATFLEGSTSVFYDGMKSEAKE